MPHRESAIKVLVADDSVVIRKALKQILATKVGLEDVSVASNGRFALDKLRQSSIDLLVIDLDITQVDTIDILKAIKQESLHTRCLVLFDSRESQAVRGVQAMRLGAIDLVSKPQADKLSELEVQRSFFSTIEPCLTRYVSELGVGLRPTIAELVPLQADTQFKTIDISKFKPKIIVIASSTGGPDALDRVLAAVRPGFNLPILIAQHMPAYFTATLAQRLSELTGLPAAEGRHGQIIENGKIYVAPGDFHMGIKMMDKVATIELDQTPPILFVRPAANKLLNSAATAFPGQVLGIILTGMGEDGAEGAVNLKRHDSAVIIQDKASSVVWGMPGSVYQQEAYDLIADPEVIAQTIVRCAS